MSPLGPAPALPVGRRTGTSQLSRRTRPPFVLGNESPMTSTSTVGRCLGILFSSPSGSLLVDRLLFQWLVWVDPSTIAGRWSAIFIDLSTFVKAFGEPCRHPSGDAVRVPCGWLLDVHTLFRAPDLPGTTPCYAATCARVTGAHGEGCLAGCGSSPAASPFIRGTRTSVAPCGAPRPGLTRPPRCLAMLFRTSRLSSRTACRKARPRRKP